MRIGYAIKWNWIFTLYLYHGLCFGFEWDTDLGYVVISLGFIRFFAGTLEHFSVVELPLDEEN